MKRLLEKRISPLWAWLLIASVAAIQVLEGDLSVKEAIVAALVGGVGLLIISQ